MRLSLHSLVIAGLLTFSPATFAAHADDASDVRSVVTQQLDAFKRDDSAAAYSFAAPNIRQIFPSATDFMTMVKSGYPVVYRSSSVTFGEMKAEGAGFRQEVFLTDPGGQSYIASYTLERQADGSLKITSCSIRKGDDLAA